MTGYDAAQICTNGHTINRSTRMMPNLNKDHCTKCGQATVTACAACAAPIQGAYYSDGRTSLSTKLSIAPAYCHACGKPYPWTALAIQALSDLLECVAGLSADERRQAIAFVPDLQSETPRTHFAVVKWKLLVGKAKAEIAAGLQKALIDLAVDSVKKLLW